MIDNICYYAKYYAQLFFERKNRSVVFGEKKINNFIIAEFLYHLLLSSKPSRILYIQPKMKTASPRSNVNNVKQSVCRTPTTPTPMHRRSRSSTGGIRELSTYLKKGSQILFDLFFYGCFYQIFCFYNIRHRQCIKKTTTEIRYGIQSS